MSPLKAILHQQINRFGALSIAEYMTLCLMHPEHGYYRRNDPLGSVGDFTTAPEISQMFGELIGLCLAQCWIDQGRPEIFSLTELGPGRGTLMADILRATKAVPGFVDAAELWLVEVNTDLRHIQKTTLSGTNIHWTERLDGLPDQPVYLVANEFFDALPIRQYVKFDDGWRERQIGLDAGELCFGLGPLLPVEMLDIPAQTGDIVEVNSASDAMISEISLRLATSGGAALIIDYGRLGAHGDSFQAVKSHEKVPALHGPGECDLSAHVNFSALAQAARNSAVSAPIAQGDLLNNLGIGQRAAILAQRLGGERLLTHNASLHRLTSPDEMGTLFKAIALYPKGTPVPPGFSP